MLKRLIYCLEINSKEENYNWDYNEIIFKYHKLFQKRFADETATIDRWLLVIWVYIYFDAAQARTNGCSRLKEDIDEGRSLIVYRY